MGPSLVAMTLKQYLRKESVYYRDFAEQGGFSIFAVRKWLNGERIPRDLNKVKIAKLTRNMVTAQDWVKGLK